MKYPNVTQAITNTTSYSFDKLALTRAANNNASEIDETDEEQVSIKNQRMNRKVKKSNTNAKNNKISVKLAHNAIMRWENNERGPYKFKNTDMNNQDHSSFDPAVFETANDFKKNPRVTSVNDS